MVFFSEGGLVKFDAMPTGGVAMGTVESTTGAAIETEEMRRATC